VQATSSSVRAVFFIQLIDFDMIGRMELRGEQKINPFCEFPLMQVSWGGLVAV